jgi:hypothetical protein
MKEKISDIILKGHLTSDMDSVPEEITSMVFEFVEWTSNDCMEYHQKFKVWIGMYGKFTSEELFNYWLTNIYKK